MDDIHEWLTRFGLSEYVPIFEENGVDIRSLGDLTEDDLKELGVKLGHRRLIQRALVEQDSIDLSSAIRSLMRMMPRERFGPGWN